MSDDTLREYSGVLHVHSRYSDSAASMPEIVRHAPCPVLIVHPG